MALPASVRWEIKWQAHRGGHRGAERRQAGGGCCMPWRRRTERRSRRRIHVLEIIIMSKLYIIFNFICTLFTSEITIHVL